MEECHGSSQLNFQGELGVNAILAVSMAACKAGAAQKEARLSYKFHKYAEISIHPIVSEKK